MLLCIICINFCLQYLFLEQGPKLGLLKTWSFSVYTNATEVLQPHFQVNWWCWSWIHFYNHVGHIFTTTWVVHWWRGPATSTAGFGAARPLRGGGRAAAGDVLRRAAGGARPGRAHARHSTEYCLSLLIHISYWQCIVSHFIVCNGILCHCIVCDFFCFVFVNAQIVIVFFAIVLCGNVCHCHFIPSMDIVVFITISCPLLDWGNFKMMPSPNRWY